MKFWLDCNAIFGGGVRAFHKYETGENTQSRPLDILLKLVNSGKVTIDDIQNIYLFPRMEGDARLDY